MWTWGEKIKIQKFKQCLLILSLSDERSRTGRIAKQYNTKGNILFNIAYNILEDLAYLFMMTEQNSRKILFTFQLCNKCWQNKSSWYIMPLMVITSHHSSTWQEMWVQVGHQDILGSVTHSNLAAYIIYANFTSDFFRLWICILWLMLSLYISGF